MGNSPTPNRPAAFSESLDEAELLTSSFTFYLKSHRRSHSPILRLYYHEPVKTRYKHEKGSRKGHKEERGLGREDETSPK